MSRSLNKVMLIGNVGADPEIKALPSGTKVAKVSLATNRTFTDRSGQQQEKTEWHRLSFFDRLADLVEQYVHRGDRLFVEGRLEYSQTSDDQGNQRYWTDIVVREMVMLGQSGGGSSMGNAPDSPAPRRRQPAPGPGPAPAPASPFDPDDDDLPF